LPAAPTSVTVIRTSTELEPAPTQEAGLVMVTPDPTKFISLIWLTEPTTTPSSRTVIAPGVSTPPEIILVCFVQYRFPDPSEATKYKLLKFPVYGFAVTEDGPIKGSPRSGSACSKPRNSYRSLVIPDCGVFLTLPEIILAIYLLFCCFEDT